MTRTRINRILSILMLLVLLVGLTTVPAFADTETVCTTCAGTGIYAGDECGECGGSGVLTSESNLAFSFWALVPPIVAIILALITKEVYSSLFIGIVLGGLFNTNFAPVRALDAVVNDGLIPAVCDNAGIFIFLAALGMLVSLINLSGGSAAFGRWASTHIKTRAGAAISTFVLGILIFVDDYFNCLAVGSVMRPICDEHRISRAKLAFLIDATAAPICMIAPVSSWAAAFSGVVEDGGIALFIRAIPYNFYSLLMIIFIVAITLMHFDYGPMKVRELAAVNNGDLGGSDDVQAESANANPRGRVIDLILPVVVLIVSCTLGLAYVGGFFSDDPAVAGNFVEAFGNTDAFAALPWGALIALVFTIIYAIARRLVSFKEAMNCVTRGFYNMVPAMIILTFACSLKNMTVMLGAKYYVAGLMGSAAAALFNLLPAIIFAVACVLSFSTGTSWGTFGILVPIVTYVFPADSALYIIGISACLAGAVFGDHCSPISDTSIMASAGAMCDHVTHVSTQMPYALTVGAVCFVSYLVAGFVQNWIISFVIALVLLFVTLIVIRSRSGKAQTA